MKSMKSTKDNNHSGQFLYSVFFLFAGLCSPTVQQVFKSMSLTYITYILWKFFMFLLSLQQL